MKIKSINTSKVTTLDYEGKTITTGIFKKPISKPVIIRKLNIDGDEQADLKHHGGADKAVYAFSADCYDYWCKTLGKETLPPGSFGENLTLSGLDESQVHIGDQFIIGECILEVSQPRVPCFKLGIAMGNKKMPKLFIESNRTGIYFRVVKEGLIAKGDAVEHIPAQENLITVQSLFRAVFDKKFKDAKAVMEKGLSCSKLSREWEQILTRRLAE
ncbi:MOSC domain-containing protein [SAR92 clade bacterium H246]